MITRKCSFVNNRKDATTFQRKLLIENISKLSLQNCCLPGEATNYLVNTTW